MCDKCPPPPAKVPERLTLEAAASGGFTVWHGTGDDYGNRSKLMFAGDLDECLSYMERTIVKVDAPAS